MNLLTVGLIIFPGLFCFLSGCGSARSNSDPALQFRTVPVVNPGTPDSLELIQGEAQRAKPGQRVVLYSFAANLWWVQPFTGRPFTEIGPDSTWRNSIHLGERYAALIVEDTYKPAAKLEKLPGIGAGVLAVASVPGRTYAPKLMRFSGYDWEARQISDKRGGKLNPYDPDNAWVDPTGALHLKITRRGDQWVCADLGLRQSLGPGSYSFLVRDVSQLDPAAVLTLYTWELGSHFNREIDVEISRWGKADSKNGQFVVQPYYEPSNVSRFEAPPGLLNLSFRWEIGAASFRVARQQRAGRAATVAEHTFKISVPNPAGAAIHINLYAFGKAPVPMKNPAEVVVESFNYAP